MNTTKDPRTHTIIGAAMRVHKELGCGFLEAVYQEALHREFLHQDIPHEREPAVKIHYRGSPLDMCYRPDFVCYESVVVELKALDRLRRREESQVINYLKASRLEVGLLLNFGAPSLEYRRLAHSKSGLDVSAG